MGVCHPRMTHPFNLVYVLGDGLNFRFLEAKIRRSKSPEAPALKCSIKFFNNSFGTYTKEGKSAFKHIGRELMEKT